MTIVGLIPCAGTASRMHNMPKFMFPAYNNKYCLLVRWCETMKRAGCDRVIIGTSTTTHSFVMHALTAWYKQLPTTIVVICVGTTNTMNETINRCLEGVQYSAVILSMPDTYVERFPLLQIEKFMKSDLEVQAVVWNIRASQIGKIGQCLVQDDAIVDIADKDATCIYEHGWGVVVFKSSFYEHILEEQPHIGYSMQSLIRTDRKVGAVHARGMYFDCGTFEGLREYMMSTIASHPLPMTMLGTLVVLAVRIDERQTSIECLMQCVRSARRHYPNDTIIAVDNGSLCTSWTSLADELGIYVLDNTSTSYGYEVGAYRAALQRFRAANYVFMQGTIEVHERLPQAPCPSIPHATAFKLVPEHGWAKVYVPRANSVLSALALDQFSEGEQVLCWNSFLCNHACLEKCLELGVFDIPVNKKIQSCTMERVVGAVLRQVCTFVDVLPEHTHTKTYLDQGSAELTHELE